MQTMVSVILLTFDNLKYTKQCVASLYEHTPVSDFELIIVDNGSRDGSAEWIKEIAGEHKNIKYILNAENRNFAGGCNQGAEIADGEFLLFLNNDTIVTPNWLPPMLECFSTDEKVGIVGNKHLFPNSDMVWHCGGVIDSRGFPKHIYLGHTSASPMVNKGREYKFVTGACLLIKKNIFEEVGGFDENYKNAYEDVDLCFKARKLNYKVFYCHESKIYHYGGLSAGRFDYIPHNAKVFFKQWHEELISDERKFQQLDDFPRCLTVENKADLYILSLHQKFLNRLSAFFGSVGKIIFSAWLNGRGGSTLSTKKVESPRQQ